MTKQYVTLSELPKLKRAFNKAVKANKEIFKFKGEEILTSYAKYLIEYMESLKK